jgi:hypothetical protein
LSFFEKPGFFEFLALTPPGKDTGMPVIEGAVSSEEAGRSVAPVL